MGTPSIRGRFAAPRSLLTLLCLVSAGCGGSGGGGGGGGGGAPLPPFTFRWTATVDAVTDGNGAAALLAGVQVGDVLTAEVNYDATLFLDGVNVSGDGRDYAAPAGLLMSYAFASGGRFTKEVTYVRARDGGTYDQWVWAGGDFGGQLLQLQDPSDVSLSLPLVIQFPTVHAQFRATLANFQSPSAILEFPAALATDVRHIGLTVTGFVILVN